MSGVSDAEHWESAYAGGDASVSWHQAYPARSLRAITGAEADRHAPIIDVGGGSSPLAGELLRAGRTDITVLDLSATALELARARLGDDAERIAWLEQDVLACQPDRRYAVWHDRAVLHFFTEHRGRASYVEVLKRALAPGGHVIIATFAPEGPDRCSGLPVQRSSSEKLMALLGPQFTEIASETEAHQTPSGHLQPFVWVVARRDLAVPHS